MVRGEKPVHPRLPAGGRKQPVARLARRRLKPRLRLLPLPGQDAVRDAEVPRHARRPARLGGRTLAQAMIDGQRQNLAPAPRARPARREIKQRKRIRTAREGDGQMRG